MIAPYLLSLRKNSKELYQAINKLDNEERRRLFLKTLRKLYIKLQRASVVLVETTRSLGLILDSEV